MSFTSNLSVAEHHAIRSVGFTPVGQVLGTCVYQVGRPDYGSCGYDTGRAPQPGYGSYGYNTAPQSGRDNDPIPTRPVERTVWRDAVLKAGAEALYQMRRQVRQHRGDGVVAVQVSIGAVEGAGLRFRAVGTAVRADGDARPPRPFTSDLSGLEFAQLISAGWVPAGLLLGLGAMVRHDDWHLRLQLSHAFSSEREVGGYTALVAAARAAARDRLAQDAARYGANVTAVARDMRLWFYSEPCSLGGDRHPEDHVAEAMVVGTAIVRFRGLNAAPPMPVLRLSGRTP